MGSLLPLLEEPDLVELMVNSDGGVWVEKLGKSMQKAGEIDSHCAYGIITTIAGFCQQIVNRQNPIIEAEFPLDGSRFAGQIPPVVVAPTFSIRKKAIAVFSLQDYVNNRIMTALQRNTICEFIKNKKNILIVGGTGSGKTTLVNAVIEEMVSQAPNERIFIIEDTSEIQCTAKNKVQYHTTPSVDMNQLLKVSLRMRPDRICVGEVRGAEALDLLDAWNTGHEGGVATLHANSADMGLQRLKSLISRNKYAPKEIDHLIGNIIHLIVHITRESHGRCIKEILRLNGYQSDKGYLLEKI